MCAYIEQVSHSYYSDSVISYEADYDVTSKIIRTLNDKRKGNNEIS
jgi:hypothetical protein